MTPHVPLPPELELPDTYAHVQGYLASVDPDLRIRRSAERPRLYVLERRCRRRPAVNTGMRDTSDIHVQARDGYIHVSTVHPNFLNKPWNIVRALKEEGTDLWAKGGAEKVANEMEYEEAWQIETRRRRRLGLFRDIAGEGYDILSRMNNDGERSRINNAGPATRPPTKTTRRPRQRRIRFAGGRVKSRRRAA
jgi:hypothetical protein